MTAYDTNQTPSNIEIDRMQLEVIFGEHKAPGSRYWHTDTYEQHEGCWRAVWSQATAIK